LEPSLPLEFHLKYFEDDYELKLIFVAVSRVSGRLSKANSRIPRKVLEPSDGSGLAKKAHEEWGESAQSCQNRLFFAPSDVIHSSR